MLEKMSERLYETSYFEKFTVLCLFSILVLNLYNFCHIISLQLSTASRPAWYDDLNVGLRLWSISMACDSSNKS